MVVLVTSIFSLFKYFKGRKTLKKKILPFCSWRVDVQNWIPPKRVFQNIQKLESLWKSLSTQSRNMRFCFSNVFYLKINYCKKRMFYSKHWNYIPHNTQNSAGWFWLQNFLPKKSFPFKVSKVFCWLKLVQYQVKVTKTPQKKNCNYNMVFAQSLRKKCLIHQFVLLICENLWCWCI